MVLHSNNEHLNCSSININTYIGILNTLQHTKANSIIKAIWSPIWVLHSGIFFLLVYSVTSVNLESQNSGHLVFYKSTTNSTGPRGGAVCSYLVPRQRGSVSPQAKQLCFSITRRNIMGIVFTDMVFRKLKFSYIIQIVFWAMFIFNN